MINDLIELTKIQSDIVGFRGVKSQTVLKYEARLAISNPKCACFNARH